MIKRYIINQLTDLSAWIGVAIIISACFLPTSVTICLGLFLIFSSDGALKERIARWSPSIKKILENK
jgi:hypothetical protein